jgi:hypothetical protein
MGAKAMSFLLLTIALSALAYAPQWLLGDRKDYRMAVRHGMAGGFVFTGIDHFVNSHSLMVRWTVPPGLRPSMGRSAHFTTG